jgi:glycosyltransferase involved in cell wall biosynthesis
VAQPTRIAFYAPLKAPDHPDASGDRTVARLLVKALQRSGAQVMLASRLRARVAIGDEAAQRRMAARGHAIADRLIAKYRRLPKRERPQIWFTYHLYYKAVDWVGPRVARALAIPYLVAEASHAPKRAGGPYAFSHAAAEAAIREADAIFCLNPGDRECLAGLVAKKRLVDLPPFLDLQAFAPHRPDRDLGRLKLATHYRLDPALPWLAVVAMMRPGDKLASYRVLGEALRHVRQPHQLLVVGDGAARPEVEQALAASKGCIAWLGLRRVQELPEIYAAADLMVWPAINEAFGMALLEAQACGCPVVAGASGGVSAIVADGETGWLSPPGDAAALAADIDFALERDLAPYRLAARTHVLKHHDIAAAAARLGRVTAKLAAS